MSRGAQYDEALRENNRLHRVNDRLRRHNTLLKKQLKWTDSATSFHVRETRMSIGQQSIYSSDLETMRALFQNFEIQKGSGYISIDSVPSLHTNLGEILIPEQEREVIDELRQLCRTNPERFRSMIQFDQFVSWWISRYKRVKSQGVSSFKLIHGNIRRTEGHSLRLKRIETRPVGKEGTLSYRIRYFYHDKVSMSTKQMSPWHDIPLYHLGVGMDAKLLHFVCEIPKWTRAKFEIATRENYNPIRQDVKYGKLRYYQHGDMMFNYGVLPQTWEDPQHTWTDTGSAGDNDPVDFVDLGGRQLRTGEIAVVKVLGCLCLIDSHDTDWKIIGINIKDPLATKLHDIDDVETFLPGAISVLREYFRIYKVCTGNKPNSFAFGEMPRSREYALRVVDITHQMWERLGQIFQGGVVPSPGQVPQGLTFEIDDRLSSVDG